MSLVTEDEAAQRREAANLDPGEDADRSADAGAEHRARHRVEHRARTSGRPSLRTDTRGRGQVRTRPRAEVPPDRGFFNFDIDANTSQRRFHQGVVTLGRGFKESAVVSLTVSRS